MAVQEIIAGLVLAFCACFAGAATGSVAWGVAFAILWPGGDASGLIALAVVAIGLPVALSGLRRLPAKG